MNTEFSKPWFLFLDDIRSPQDAGYDLSTSSRLVVARSTASASLLVQEYGMPKKLFLDHDLGGDDTSMVFLHWLASEFWNGETPIPEYCVHSANPIGKANIAAFMNSWQKSIEL